MSVRPWNAPSKLMMAERPVAARANLTAFSTASAPELNSATLRSPPTFTTRRSASSIYDSYGTTEKSVWLNLAACAVTASTTRGWE
jgi:hypothetical protein